MFIRRIPNKNGKIYIQAVHKVNGRYRVAQSFGGSSDPEEIRALEAKASAWISQSQGLELDFTDEAQLMERYFASIQGLQLVGLELLLGGLFDEIGFNAIEDPIFRHLVIFRIAFPVSKLKTTEYLLRYQGISWSEDQVYRYLDKLYYQQKERVQEISFRHSQRVLGSDIKMVFYDVTTLYFEIDHEDSLRKTGFSKEGKHQKPQIVLGLLISKQGYPMAYDIFQGNQFEGQTMLPVIEGFTRKYGLDQLVVVADSGLMSKANIETLHDKGYAFILGARIKNESKELKTQILSSRWEHGQIREFRKGDFKLIVAYSEKRAAKDAHNRQKGLKRLEKQLNAGRLTKAHINKRGYNKYLTLQGRVSISIDYQKFQEDQLWDGLKGYLTNSSLSQQEVIGQYQQLWQVEKAFRISKTDLKIRPVFHQLPRRIEAHMCIAFAAYKVFKELERQLQIKQAPISVHKAIEIAENIYQIQIQSPLSQNKVSKTLLLTQEQRLLARLFNFGC